MKSLGKSQRALAEELGVSPAYISQIFSGKKNPPDLGKTKDRLLLKKWSKFLEISAEELLDMVRFDLHRIPLRPAAKFPQMRALLFNRLDGNAEQMIDEIRSLSLHPAENLAVRTMVELYVVLHEDIKQGRAYGQERFKDFCLWARSDRDFVDNELVRFFKGQDFTWSWNNETGRVLFVPQSEEIIRAMRLTQELSTKTPPEQYELTVPLVGHVSAGEGFEYTDGGFTAGEGFEQVDPPPGLTPALARCLYCVKVRGDSLREFFRDGALLFIKPESWEEIRDGDLVIFKDKRDRKAFVKKVEFSGDSLILKSMNSFYKNMVLKKSDLVLLERVTAIVL